MPAPNLTVAVPLLAIVAVGMIVDRVIFRNVELRIRRRWGLVAEA